MAGSEALDRVWSRRSAATQAGVGVATIRALQRIELVSSELTLTDVVLVKALVSLGSNRSTNWSSADQRTLNLQRRDMFVAQLVRGYVHNRSASGGRRTWIVVRGEAPDGVHLVDDPFMVASLVCSPDHMHDSVVVLPICDWLEQLLNVTGEGAGSPQPVQSGEDLIMSRLNSWSETVETPQMVDALSAFLVGHSTSCHRVTQELALSPQLVGPPERVLARTVVAVLMSDEPTCQEFVSSLCPGVRRVQGPGDLRARTVMSLMSLAIQTTQEEDLGLALCSLLVQPWDIWLVSDLRWLDVVTGAGTSSHSYDLGGVGVQAVLNLPSGTLGEVLSGPLHYNSGPDISPKSPRFDENFKLAEPALPVQGVVTASSSALEGEGKMTDGTDVYLRTEEARVVDVGQEGYVETHLVSTSRSEISLPEGKGQESLLHDDYLWRKAARIGAARSSEQVSEVVLGNEILSKVWLRGSRTPEQIVELLTVSSALELGSEQGT